MTQISMPHIPSNPLDAKPIDRPKFSSSQASLYLDVLRGVASLLVLLGHIRFIFFQDLSLLPTHRMLFRIPYIILAGGHQAVIVLLCSAGISSPGRFCAYSRRMCGVGRAIFSTAYCAYGLC